MGWILVIVLVALAIWWFYKEARESRLREQRKHELAAKLARQEQERREQTTAQAILARRLNNERNHEEDGTAAVLLKSGQNKRTMKWHGQIVTASGKILWQCSSGHSRRRSGYRTAKEASQAAARECAAKELSNNEQKYKTLAGKRVGDGTGNGKRLKPIPAGFDNWEAIQKAFEYRCAYCGEASYTLHADHVIPLSRGGDHSFNNILPACERCNLSKGTKRLDDFLKMRPSLGIPKSPWFP